MKGAVLSRLAVVLVGAAVLGACGGGEGENETRQPPSPAGAVSPTETPESEPDARVSYDGRKCTSTHPKRHPVGEFLVEVASRSDASVDLIIGYYERGFGRRDMVDYLRSKKGQFIARPPFANDVSTVRASPGDRTLQPVTLVEPRRYYLVCLVKNYTEGVLLGELVVEEG